MSMWDIFNCLVYRRLVISHFQSGLVIIIFLCFLLLLLVEGRWNTFDIQELTHDMPAVNLSNQLKLEAYFNEGLKYNLPRTFPNQTTRYFLSKPYKVREIEFLSSNLDSLVTVNNQGNPPYFEFFKVNAIHRGNYSLYRFDYDYNDNLVNYSRLDFQLIVHGLRRESNVCTSRSQCDSDSCPFGRCVCNERNPIYRNYTCHTAKYFNETCLIDEECQYLAGSKSRCFNNKCTCNHANVPIRVSSLDKNLRQCVTLANLHHRCLYSMECNLENNLSNRYCSEKYICQCLPGFRLEGNDGRHYCSLSISLHYNQFVLSTTILISSVFFTLFNTSY